MVKQLTVFLENSPGRLADLTRAIGNAGINMRALMVADTADFGVVRIICDDPAFAQSALEAAGYGVTVTDVIAVVVPDRPGGLADVLEVLGAADINVEYAYCFVKPSGEGAIDVLRVEDPAHAARVLGQAAMRVLTEDEIRSTG